jgi:hypothetical protein
MDEEKKLKIEKIAWQRFLAKTGLSLRKDLPLDIKKTITDLPDYQKYRDEALKIYDQRQMKKEKAVFNKKYPVINVPASGKPVWYGGARTMAFVYSRDHGNFVLEGFSQEVEEYLKKNYTHYFFYHSMWSDGQSRGHWKFWKDNIGIFEPDKHRKTWKYEVRPYSGGYRHVELSTEELKRKTFHFKRLPKRWISEFNKL